MSVLIGNGRITSVATAAALAVLNNTEVRVQVPSDLAGTLDSLKVYVIDGDIDMGTQAITVPQGGLTLKGFGFNPSKLTSSANNYTMFIDDGVFSGDIFITGMQISVTGTTSKVFDLDNAENGDAIEFDTVNFQDCTSLGTVKSFRQGLAQNVVLFYPGGGGAATDGLTFDGIWSGGFAILDSIILSAPAISLFKAGATLSFQGSFRSNLNALSINDSAVVFDFVTANFVQDSGFLLESVRTNKNANAVPNIAGSDPKSQFRNCSGIRNTYRGAGWTITTAAATVIATVNTPVVVAGTTTYGFIEHFTQAGDNNITSNTDEAIEVDVAGAVTISGTEGEQLSILLRKFDDSTSSYSTLETYIVSIVATTGGRDPGAENVPLFAETNMDKNDRIEIWVENNSTTANITAELGSRLKVTERPS